MQKYIFLVLILFLIACENKKKEDSRYNKEQIASLHLESTKILAIETDSITTVDLNPFLKTQNYDFGSLVKEIKLIPLETKGESLLDNIKKVVVTDSNIYIHDDFKGGGLVVFDNKGKFIRRIPKGHGPGELNRLYDIDFDKSKNELVAYEHSYLLFYTPAGEFIRQERLLFACYNFTVIPNGYVFKTLDGQGNEHMEGLKDYTLLVTDKKFKLKSVGLTRAPIENSFASEYNLYNNNNALYLTQSFTDTIFQYISATNRFKARYVLDYSENKLPEKQIQVSFDKFENYARKNNQYFYKGKYLDSKFTNVFYLENWYLEMETIVFRDKKTGHLIGGTGATYDSSEIPLIAFPISVSGDYFISLYSPSPNDLFPTKSKIISNADKLKIKGLTENDNPVLVFYKIKNF